MSVELPTIKDIADRANVSIATVSRVLNRKGRYSKETEDRVLRTVEEMKYVKNVAAQQLKTRRTNYIGILVPDITNEFFAKAIQVIQLDLLRQGYTSFICNTNEDVQLERMQLDMLKEQNAAGIIYVSGTLPWEDELGKVPLVFIDRKPLQQTERQVSLVESDNREGSKLAAAKFFEQGSKKLAVLSPGSGLSSHTIRREAFVEEIEALGLNYDPALNLTVPQVSYEEARNTVAQALRDGLNFDALYCTSDWLAIGALDALVEAGRQVPEEVSVIGFDDISMARLRDLPLTTIRQDVTAMAQKSVEILLALIENPRMHPTHEVIPVELIERATTRPN